jgi:hypothetical protein
VPKVKKGKIPISTFNFTLHTSLLDTGYWILAHSSWHMTKISWVGSAILKPMKGYLIQTPTRSQKLSHFTNGVKFYAEKSAILILPLMAPNIPFVVAPSGDFLGPYGPTTSGLHQC